jgi:hypothetical protein
MSPRDDGPFSYVNGVMLTVMKNLRRACARSPEHDTTHGFNIVRLVSYRRPAQQTASAY